MSIFREPFSPEISGQLKARQDLVGKENRTSQDTIYLNSKNAWIQLRSAVDIVGSLTEGGSLPVAPTKLAADNVLMGGTLLDNNTQRKGLGEFNTAYSRKTYNKSLNEIEDNLLGLRPMPGITGISIQNKSAYGSLRQATVEFKCWDIKQLEVLETLYMRPGFTVLLEWGWLPYIDNKGILADRLYQDELFFGRKNINIQQYLEQLRNLSIKSYGNYDAMFGYVMNYNWKYRLDGGFDCSVDIISTGEILESLKINSSGAYISTLSNGTLLSSNSYNFSDNVSENIGGFFGTEEITKIQRDYRKNILLGLISETYALCRINMDATSGVGSVAYENTVVNKKGTIDFARYEIELETDGILSDDDDAAQQDPGGNKTNGSVIDLEENIYITLRSFVELLNNFILLENSEDSSIDKNIIKLSLEHGFKSINKGKPLECLYNPLQISVDPRVCMIKNPLFISLTTGIKTSSKKDIDETEVQIIPPDPNTVKSYKDLIKQLVDIREKDGSMEEFKAVLSKINDKGKLAGIADEYYRTYNKTFYNFLIGDDFKSSSFKVFNVADPFSGIGLTKDDVEYFENDFRRFTNNLGFFLAPDILEKAYIIFEYIDITPQERINQQVKISKEKKKEESETLNEAKQEIAKNAVVPGYLQFLSTLPKEYHGLDSSQITADHGSIYINLRLLYNLAASEDLEGQDPGEKQDINLMTYLKDMLKYIQNSIGNVNNFEVIIDDNVGYIIDLNNISPTNITPFEFQIGNKLSLIRDITLESQIFSDQSTIIAISAQSEAGKLGLENSSLIAYNRGVKDRLIEKKDNPIASRIRPTDQNAGFATALLDLAEFFESMNQGLNGDSELFVDEISKFKKALSDVIAFYTSLFKTDNKYRAILPTKLSFTIDGIGGLIIGNIFKINKDFIPYNYKEKYNIGVDLFYIITGLKHNIESNGQWTTTIEANPIISDESYNQLIKQQGDIVLDLSLANSTLIYDSTTGQVQAISNISTNEPPPGVTGDNRAMASALNYTFGAGSRKGDGKCNRYTYNLAKKYIQFRKGEKNISKGATDSSGGKAASQGAIAAYNALGYTTTQVATNFTKAQMETYLGDHSKWNVGEVASYISSDGAHFHAQIYHGGMIYNSQIKSYNLDPKANRWASDDSTNYNGNFIYKNQPQNSYTLYVSKLTK